MCWTSSPCDSHDSSATAFCPSDTRSDSGVLMATEEDTRPLKKRPVHIPHSLQDRRDPSDGESSRPENLSMKPEDLRLQRKILTDPPVVTLSSSTPALVQDRLRPKSSATLLRQYLQSSSPLLPHKTQEFLRISLTDHLTLNKPVNSYPYDSSNPLHLFTPQSSSHFFKCSSAKEKNTDFYSLKVLSEESWLPFDFRRDSTHHDLKVEKLTVAGRFLSNSSRNNCELSTASPIFHGESIRTPSPSVTPEDLSSPGSVASSGGCSTGCYGKIKNEINYKHYRYKCSVCLKPYSTISGLRKHQKFQCTEINFSNTKQFFGCKSCEKVYVSLGALKMHIRTHTLPCKCDICGKAFSRPWLLQGHIRTHTGEKPFRCPLCERAFADRSNLRAHLQTHSEVKKYSCSTCGKTFSRMSLLTKHLSGGCLGPRLPPEDSMP